MSIITWSLAKAKKFTLVDWILFKLNLAIFGVMIGAYVSNFVQTNIWIFVGVFVLLEVTILTRMLKK